MPAKSRRRGVSVMDKSDDAGYCKPPKKWQFKPGQSGNPRGRPKGTKNLKTDLQEELSEKVRIREGDKFMNVSKQRISVKRLVEGAAKGEPRQLDILFNLAMRLLPPEDIPNEALTRDEKAILAQLLERNRGLSADQQSNPA